MLVEIHYSRALATSAIAYTVQKFVKTQFRFYG